MRTTTPARRLGLLPRVAQRDGAQGCSSMKAKRRGVGGLVGGDLNRTEGRTVALVLHDPVFGDPMVMPLRSLAHRDEAEDAVAP